MTGIDTFWNGVARRELLLPVCDSCGRPHFYPRSACPFCWSEALSWRPSPGLGTVYTFAVVRNNAPMAFELQIPFTIAVVELDEGVRLLANIAADEVEIAIGDRVAVDFEDRDGRTLPVFRRAAG